MAAIQRIDLRKIFDSKGELTIEAKITGRSGKYAIASSPAGTSRSMHEAVPLPEGSADLAIKRFGKVRDKFRGIDASEQELVDELLYNSDNTSNFSRLGGAVSTAVSIAAAKLAAIEEGLELYEYVYENFMKRYGIRKSIPRPLGNIIGGGAHSGNRMAIQEVLVAADAGSAFENAMINWMVHKEAGKIFTENGAAGIGKNIEGGWSTPFNELKSLAIASLAVKRTKEKTGRRISLGIDAAGSQLYKHKTYTYGKKSLSAERQIAFMMKLKKKFGLEYIEDPMYEEDFEGFAKITSMAKDALVVGDDIYATNTERLEMGIDASSTNAVLIKVNQAGTLTDTINVVRLAHENSIANVVSHRSGETDDTFIAHLAVAFGSKYIKCGVVGGERVAKINELIRIEGIEKS